MNLSGYSLTNVAVKLSDQFKELYPDKTLPKFYWLVIFGIKGIDDFGRTDDGRLVISDRVYEILKSLELKGADFEEYNS